MVRTLAVVIGLALSLAVAREASPLPVTIPPLDLDSRGGSLVRTHADLFTGGDASTFSGALFTSVFFEFNQLYRYELVVFPLASNIEVFETQFSVKGFTGIAGWRFADSLLAGGDLGDRDFLILEEAGHLTWFQLFGEQDPDGGFSSGWDAFEPITFFFVSTRPPGEHMKGYHLTGGTTQSLAPVPEPGSIVLFGSGLVGLYAARRRRRVSQGSGRD